MKYCSGKHKCEICGVIYPCTGETSLHDGNTSSGRCNGEYIQFCSNHSPEEYRLQHIKNGELIA